MLDEKDLQAIREIMREEIREEINASEKRMTAMINDLKESEAVTRDGVNALLQWAEDISTSVAFPLPRVGDHTDA